MAPSLATADRSSPGTVLGAVSGIAGAGGLGAVAQGAGLGAKAYSLSKTDFSNPGAVLGAAAAVAGLGQLAGGDAATGSKTVEALLTVGSELPIT